MADLKFGHYTGEEQGMTLRVAKAAAGLPLGLGWRCLMGEKRELGSRTPMLVL
jgi:hypothetical protein